MRNRRKAALLLIAACVLLLFTGCKQGMTGEDAKGYVKSVLDAGYKGDYKEYMKQTDSTEAESKKLYEDSVDNLMQNSGIKDLGLSDELTGKFRQMFADLLKGAKYEIGEAKENDDKEFDVTVKAYPYPTFSGLDEQVEQEIQAEVSQMENIPDDAQFNEMYYQRMYEKMDAIVKNPQYGEPESITLHVQKDNDGIYYIPDEELEELDVLLYPAD